MQTNFYESKLRNAIEVISRATSVVAFTGAGISVESGIPPFRGEDGLWNRYDPRTLELNYFYNHPAESWRVIREIFYTHFGSARPNAAHEALATMEQSGKLKGIITQNIDNLHQQAGSRTVVEFHGNAHHLICTQCKSRYAIADTDLAAAIPSCPKDSALLKPDFIFFGEGIPAEAYAQSRALATGCDVMLVIGTTGEVMPAATMPIIARDNGATIIEINPDTSEFSSRVAHIHLKGKAGEVLVQILEALSKN